MLTCSRIYFYKSYKNLAWKISSKMLVFESRTSVNPTHCTLIIKNNWSQTEKSLSTIYVLKQNFISSCNCSIGFPTVPQEFPNSLIFQYHCFKIYLFYSMTEFFYWINRRLPFRNSGTKKLEYLAVMSQQQIKAYFMFV